MSGRSFCFIVTEEYAGRRADEVLRAVIGMSARQIRLIKHQKGFYLDGRSVYANALVQPGQELRAVCENAYDQGIEPEAGPLSILYEDEHLMVLDKPAPMATLPAPGQPCGTLANRVAALYGEERFIFRPVNRLDKGTSGLMVAARHPLAQKRLMEQLHTETFVREYEALVEGVLTGDMRIDAPIDRMPGDSVRRCVCEGGKPSLTQVSVLAVSPQTNCTHVKLRLYTGRTHQIRVHMAHIGHPVLGDYLYGTPRPELDGRFALHAAHLTLRHPFTGEWLTMHSALPEALQALWQDG